MTARGGGILLRNEKRTTERSARMNHSKIARLGRGATELRQQLAQQPGNVFSRPDHAPRTQHLTITLVTHVGASLIAGSRVPGRSGAAIIRVRCTGKSASTLNTGSYCNARARLPAPWGEGWLNASGL